VDVISHNTALLYAFQRRGTFRHGPDGLHCISQKTDYSASFPVDGVQVRIGEDGMGGWGAWVPVMTKSGSQQ
jgi:hypothetical protein